MFTPILSLLTEPPGNLAYHLVLAFSIAATLQAILLQPGLNSPSRKRALWGIAGLLGIQAILFLIGGLAWQGLANAPAILPPVERAAGLLGLIGILWLWLFPDRKPLADWLAIGLSLAALVYLAVSISFWTTWGAGLVFSTTWIDFYWNLSGIVIALAGIIYAIWRRPGGWGFPAASAGLLLLGYLAQLLNLIPASNYPGILRLAQLAAFPMLLLLSHRFEVAKPEPAATVIDVHKPGYGVDATTFQALFELINEPRSDIVLAGSARVLADSVRADSCLVIGMPGANGEMLVFSGYDLVKDTPLKPSALNASSFPIISRALSEGSSLIWSRSAAPAEEVAALRSTTGYANPVPLMFLPLKDPNFGPVGGLMLLSPHSNRAWNVTDQAYLAPACEWLARLIAQPSEAAPAREVQVVSAEAQSAWGPELAGISTQELFPTSGADQSSAQDLLDLLNVQEELRQTIQQLETENQRIKQSAGPAPSRADGYLEKELQKSLVEVARLQNSLAEANADVLRLQQSSLTSNLAPARQAEVLASLVQEIREPMASLAGYSDLLLQETSGPLSVMQRKFLERIKVSVGRMQVLVDDLVQVSVLENTPADKPEPQMDLASVIEHALDYTGSQIREKNLNLELDVPSHLPVYGADGDALEQVLIHLLQNAAMVTPKDGSIALIAQLQQHEGANDAIRLQVVDHGGGIREEDLPRVFSRMFRSVALPVPGIGDNGVGLSITKTLVEAMGGRIWAESEMGVSTTFHVLLPVNLNITAAESQLEG